GLLGPAGPIGAAGATGAIGPQGPAGPAGPEGVDGVIGATGPQGPTGATGVQGPAGPSAPRLIQALHLNSGIPFNASSQVQIQVLNCDRPVTILITGYFLQYDSMTGQPYQTSTSATQNFTGTNYGTVSLFSVPTSSQFVLTDVVAIFPPTSASSSTSGIFYGNILQNSNAKASFAFPDPQSNS
ncbi:MAG: hypothetical protein P4L55_09780, partial [Syntrophobacteraceae bacterium]|nr:hypothetical protein [Syntrophobacteraceae bacterium]